MELIDQEEWRRKRFTSREFTPSLGGEVCSTHGYSSTASHNATSRTSRRKYRERSKASRRKLWTDKKRRNLEGCKKIEEYFPKMTTQNNNSTKM
jgi:hypothetical protein